MADEEKSINVVHVENFEPPHPIKFKNGRNVVSVEIFEPPSINRGINPSHMTKIDTRVRRWKSIDSDVPANFKKGKPLQELLAADVQNTSGDIVSSRKVAKVETFEPKVARRQSVVSCGGGSTESKTASEINGLPKRRVVSVESFELPKAKPHTHKSHRRAGDSHAASISTPTRAVARSNRECSPVTDAKGTHLPPLSSSASSSSEMAQSRQQSRVSTSAKQEGGGANVPPRTRADSVGTQSDDLHHQNHLPLRRRGGGVNGKGRLKKANLARLNEKYHHEISHVAPSAALPPLPSSTNGQEGPVAQQLSHQLHSSEANNEVNMSPQDTPSKALAVPSAEHVYFIVPPQDDSVSDSEVSVSLQNSLLAITD